MSITDAIKKCIRLHNLIQILGLNVEKPIVFFDSRSAFYLEKNLIYHANTKHTQVNNVLKYKYFLFK